MQQLTPQSSSANGNSSTLSEKEEGDLAASSVCGSGNDNMGSRRISSTRKCTNLHSVCANSVLLREIRIALSANTSDASVKDSKGRLPLHLLAENKKLFEKLTGNSDVSFYSPVESFMLEEYLPLCPGAATTVDDNGHIPFLKVVFDWVVDTHTNKSKVLQESIHLKLDDSNHDSEVQSTVFENVDDIIETDIPTEVILTSQVEWSIMMLETILQKVSESESQSIVEHVAAIPSVVKMLFLISDADKRTKLLTTSLVQQVLLCETTVGKWLVPMLTNKLYRVQESAIIYLHMISTIDSDEWQKKQALLRLPSSLGSPNIQDKVAIFAKWSEHEDDLILATLHLNSKLFNEVARMDVIHWILDERVFCPGKSFALYAILSDLFFFVLLIASFRTNTTFYFDGIPADADNDDLDNFALQTTTFFLLVSLSVLYFFCREFNALRNIPINILIRHYRLWKLIDIVSIFLALVVEATYVYRLLASPRVNHWKLAGSMYYDTSSFVRTLASLTTLLLWIKAVGYVKNLNRHLATYVSAIVNITKDIFWFLLLLALIVFASGQMFHTLLFQPLRQECMGSHNNSTSVGNTTSQHESIGTVENPFCSSRIGLSYMYVYKIMLGDFEMKDFYTPLAVFLFVMYTFAVVIIMLNVLIAIISDSYDRSVLNSAQLFTETRVLFVADITALERGVKTRYVLRLSIVLFISFFQFLFAWSLGYDSPMLIVGILVCAISYGVMFFLMKFILQLYPRFRFIIITTIIPFVLALVIWWLSSGRYLRNVASRPAAEEFVSSLLLGMTIGCVEAFVVVWYNFVVGPFQRCMFDTRHDVDKFLGFILQRLLTRTGNISQSGTHDDNGKEQWEGRLSHLESRIIKIVGESEQRLAASLENFEAQLQELKKSEAPVVVTSSDAESEGKKVK